MPRSQATTCPAGVRRPRTWRRSWPTISGRPASAPWRCGRGPAAALPCEPDADLPDVGPIQARLEDPDAWPPDGIAFTVAATDVQSNRIETLILGMPADRSWGAVLEYHVTRGRPTEAAVWAALQAIWDDAGVRLGAIDAGYLPQPVKALATRDARCLPIRGMAGPARQPIGAPKRRRMVLHGRLGWPQARSTREGG